jgi:hypothetical protein
MQFIQFLQSFKHLANFFIPARRLANLGPCISGFANPAQDGIAKILN